MRGLAAAAFGLLLAGPAEARVLTVGVPGQGPTLEDVARQAEAGDTIQLPAGQFFACASIAAADVVVQGVGVETVITDRVCEGKALLVARGARLVVRDLVLARARTPDQNGAGIRLEGQGLTVERVRFDNDEVGVLAAAGGPGRVEVRDCVFSGGGVGGANPHYALMVPDVALLQVSGSTFSGEAGGQVDSGAVETVLEHDRIEAGAKVAEAFAVRAGGHLVMRDDVVVLGPNPTARDAAVLAMGPGAELTRVRLENQTGRAAVLLLDWGGGAALEDVVVGAGDTASGRDGLWRHRAGAVVHGVADEARSAAGMAKRALKALVGR